MSAITVPMSWTTTPTRGSSETADFIFEEIKKTRQQLEGSFSFGQPINELIQVYQDCRNPGWDGYNALPVLPDTLSLASDVLSSFPLGTPSPSFGAEPDGHITMEWHHSPYRTLSVSISPEKKLHFAALIGTNTYYGTENFYGEISRNIKDLIHRVLRA
ncbi:MAG: hypothetical protein ACYDBP_13695 [Leptospirales bacterium]